MNIRALVIYKSPGGDCLPLGTLLGREGEVGVEEPCSVLFCSSANSLSVVLVQQISSI